MVIMVSNVKYDQTGEALLDMQREEVRKEEFPTTYNIELEDIRIGGRDVEEIFKNAYLSQIQYYLKRVWIKIVGVPGDINLDKYVIEPRNHGGQEDWTIKQLIMEEATYIKENGTKYKNPVKKIQRVRNGGGWQLTGKNQELSNLAHFGYQVLP